VSVLLVLLVAIGLFLVVRARPAPGPLDPRSGRDDGARALVLLLEGQGAIVDVDRSPPPPRAETRALVLDDSLDADQRRDLLLFVESGGVAVVADPSSTLHGGPGLEGGAIRVTAEVPDAVVPSPASVASEANVANTICTIRALEELRGVFVRDGILFPVGPDEPQCLAGDGHAFVIRREIGSGTVVGLGDNRLLSNELIRFADNSGLAVALLAPRARARVTVVVGSSAPSSPEDVGTGEDTLGDLVRPGVWMGLAQLAVAFAVLALARGIRPGRPVEEEHASPLAGSDAVRAHATMMRRAGHHAHAGSLLRAELHRELCERYRLDRTSPVDVIDRAFADHEGVPGGVVASVLSMETADAGSLLELSNRITAVRAHWSRRSHVAPATGGAPR
jgi:hypothetical protein